MSKTYDEFNSTGIESKIEAKAVQEVFYNVAKKERSYGSRNDYELDQGEVPEAYEYDYSNGRRAKPGTGIRR